MKNELKPTTKIRAEYPDGTSRETTYKELVNLFWNETDTWKGWFSRSLEEGGTVKTQYGARYTLITIKPENLIQRMANASHTSACCGGHNKADMNYSLIKQYVKEAEERGIEIPDRSEWPEGVFNGFGSV